MKRPEVTDESLLEAINQATIAIGRRIEQKGRGAFVSSHEALGVIAEEYHELIDAVKNNDPMDVANESLDVAVGCIFTVASMIQKDKDMKSGS